MEVVDGVGEDGEDAGEATEVGGLGGGEAGGEAGDSVIIGVEEFGWPGGREGAE